MTRWRVDHEIKSDLVLAKTEKQIVFKAPDRSHEIYLITRRGPGKHAAVQLTSRLSVPEIDLTYTPAVKAVRRRIMSQEWLGSQYTIYIAMPGGANTVFKMDSESDVTTAPEGNEDLILFTYHLYQTSTTRILRTLGIYL